ncbi:helix-turn-helix transcriptional regulator [Streptomyces sp. NPDC050636]|uniref:helix-turn-helix transcriptional regulator n=1 Tax=Streptomyces sp. NPDC050636 TaxID=3154510 RepID=UPI00342260A5
MGDTGGSVARGTGTFDGAALRILRQQAGLSAARLAARVGTSKAAILAYEKGKRVPEARRVAELAGALGHPDARALCPPSPDVDVLSLELLRRQRGLTAARLAEVIGISRSTYRRIEQEAWLPSRGRGTVPVRLAEVLGVSLRTVTLALHSHPSAVQRREQATEHLGALFKRAHEVGMPAVVDPDEDDLLALAALIGHPAGVVCRLVNQEIGNYRALLKERERYTAEAAYAQNDRERRNAEALLAQTHHRIESAPQAAAGFLADFLDDAMTFRQWRALVSLSGAGRRVERPEQGVELHESFDPDVWPGLLDRRVNGRPLIRERLDTQQDVKYYSPTDAGLIYYETSREVYGALYPRQYAPPPQRPRVRYRPARYPGRVG